MSINYGINYDYNNNGNVMAGRNKRSHVSGASHSNSKTRFKVWNDIIYCV